MLYLAQTFEDEDPRPYSLDGALEFPPHKFSRTLPLAMPQRGFGNNPSLKIWDYDALAGSALGEPAPPYPLIRTCFPSWDNDSRRQGAASVIHGSTPDKFGGWLEGLVRDAEQARAAPAIVCINAWNEWGEGAYLEPDRHFGYAYLNMVQAVMHRTAASALRRVLLVGHDAFPAGAQRLLVALGRTLRDDFGVEISFVLLRADAGYDGLLQTCRAIAETHVVPADAGELVAMLATRGFSHAIVNSAASAPLLAPLAAAGITCVQLVHELPTMLARLGTAPQMVHAARHGTRFIAPTAAIADMLERLEIAPAQIGVRAQGQYRRLGPIDPVAARATMGLDPLRTIVASLGFADQRKGADLFVGTAEAAHDAGAPILFVWQGNWDDGVHAELAARLAALIRSGAVLLLPDDGAIELLLGAADMFFLPSREDPLPSAAIEAWSCGVPVVAIRGAGGVADLIAEDGTRGRLAERADPAALIEAVRSAEALGRSPALARWAAERFNWPHYVRDLLRDLYRPPTVDVVIVGHNHGRFAERRVTSIVRQTLAPRGVSYVDVASTDGSVGVISDVCTRLGVTLSARETNDGRLFSTWEEIATASDAVYLHIAEGDDWIAPAMIERCVAALASVPAAAYAFCAVEWIDADDRVIADHRDYPASVIGADIAQGGEIAAARLLASDFVVRNPILSLSSVVWRRECLLALIRANRPALETLEFAFDWLLYLRAANAGHSAAFVPDLLCRHRQHAESFASRDDMARHIAEIARVHQLQAAPAAGARRATYLDSLR